MSEDQIESSDPLADTSTEDLLAEVGKAANAAIPLDYSLAESRADFDEVDKDAEVVARYLQLRLLHRIADTLDKIAVNGERTWK